mmetsp:Transcript_8726/g.21019  ORF Transcript_8726/g.21019 Transcript_8726/m.21019 type:complete len:92 (+) Transcript_8726:512-787(+)
MLALFIRLKRLGNQAVTRKEITAVIMQLLARRERTCAGGKIEKLSKVAKRALKRRVQNKSNWPRFVGPLAMCTRVPETAHKPEYALHRDIE